MGRSSPESGSHSNIQGGEFTSAMEGIHHELNWGLIWRIWQNKLDLEGQQLQYGKVSSTERLPTLGVFFLEIHFAASWLIKSPNSPSMRYTRKLYFLNF